MLAGLIVIVVLIASRVGIPALFGEAAEPGGLVNRTINSEDFSDGPGEWGTESSGTATAEVSDSTYNIHLQNKDDELWPAFFDYERSWESIAVEASARPLGDGRTGFGIGCVMSTNDQSGGPGTGSTYTFAILPWKESYVIIHDDLDGKNEVIEMGTVPAESIFGPGPLHLRATCSTTEGTSTDLAFFVDSRQIAIATDPDGPGAFNGMEIGAFTMDANGEVRFDDTVMKRT